MIELVDINKKFLDGKEESCILSGVDLSIEKEEFVTIMGESGSGKSTLLNIMGLLLEPSAGSVIYNGEKVNFKDEKKVNQIRRESVGLVFQNANLIHSLNPLENILLAMDSNEAYPKRKKRILDLLDMLGIADKYKANIKSLSGGEAQRVSIVRALINKPDVLLCDEPTGALDKKTSDHVLNLLKKTQEETKCSLVIVTHDPGIGSLGNKRILMKRGKAHGMEENI